MKIRIATVAATALVVGCVVVVSAQPAYADGTATFLGARTFYDTSANRITSTDTAADGKSSVARVRSLNGSWHKLTNSGGNGTSRSWKVNAKNYRWLQIQACT